MAVNQVPLTPLTLLERTARIFPTRIATVYDGERRSYGEFYERVCRLANGLAALGVAREGRVAVLAPNIPMMLEAHSGIPLAGGVIVAINTRLNGREIATILEHSGSEVLLVDRGLAGVLEPVWGELRGLRHVILVDDPALPAGEGWRPEGSRDYEEFLAAASADEPVFTRRSDA